MLHVAAVLDPEVEDRKLLAWGQVHEWSEVLEILKTSYPERAAKGEFEPAEKVVEGMKGMETFKISADDSETLDILHRWSGRDEKGWQPLKQIVESNMESIYKFFP